MTAEITSAVWSLLAAFWWLLVFAAIAPLAHSTWLFYRQTDFKKKLEWVLLELQMPREIKKSPRAMEMALAQIHQLRNAPGDIKEWYYDGEVTRWFSLELASFGGETHFYLRCYVKYRDLVEAAIFAYYPDVEITEVEDYVERFPQNTQEMYRQGYNLWGSEMRLARHAAYPIRSYLDFESPDEDKQYDPIGTFLEVLSKVQREQMVAIQILITPITDDWKKSAADIVSKLSEMRKSPTSASKAKLKASFPGGPLPSFETVAPTKEEGFQFRGLLRSPGETDVLKAVENNLAKPSYNTLIRFIYFSPHALYYDSFPRRGITGAFNQYGSSDLNMFKRNDNVSTKTEVWNWPHLFSKIRVEYRKQRLLYNFRARRTPETYFIGKLVTSHLFNLNFYSREFPLSTESLATLFHPPTFQVLTAPHIQRVDSRKAGPPAGLSIFGGEEDIEKYQ